MRRIGHSADIGGGHIGVGEAPRTENELVRAGNGGFEHRTAGFEHFLGRTRAEEGRVDVSKNAGAARSSPPGGIDALEEVMVCSGRKPQYLRSDNGREPSRARSPAAGSPEGEAQPRQFVAKSVQKWLEDDSQISGRAASKPAHRGRTPM